MICELKRKLHLSLRKQWNTKYYTKQYKQDLTKQKKKHSSQLSGLLGHSRSRSLCIQNCTHNITLTLPTSQKRQQALLLLCCEFSTRWVLNCTLSRLAALLAADIKYKQYDTREWQLVSVCVSTNQDSIELCAHTHNDVSERVHVCMFRRIGGGCFG